MASFGKCKNIDDLKFNKILMVNFLIDLASSIVSRKALFNPKSQRLCPMFYSKSFVVLALTFTSVIYLHYCYVWCGFKLIIFGLNI